MLSIQNARRLLCLVLCVQLTGCGQDQGDNEKNLPVPNAKNHYTDSKLAGWIWQGTGGEVGSETQIWQLTFPLLSPNTTSPSRFYPPPFPDQANWDIKTTGDFNGDGSADFLWRHRTRGTLRVWQMRNGLRIGQNSLSNIAVTRTWAWAVVGAGDTDKDGDDDVILNNSDTGEVMILQMQEYAVVAAHAVGKKAGYTVNRIGDFNKDGDADLMLRGAGADILSIWEIETNTLVRERKFPRSGADWNPVCAADFDKDGDDDIMLLSNTDNQQKWFVIENYARVAQKIGSPNIDYKFLGCSDYDGDGDADTLWQNKSNARIRAVLQQNYGPVTQAIYTNPFGGTDPANSGYGFEYRGNSN